MGMRSSSMFFFVLRVEHDWNKIWYIPWDSRDLISFRWSKEFTSNSVQDHIINHVNAPMAASSSSPSSKPILADGPGWGRGWWWWWGGGGGRRRRWLLWWWWWWWLFYVIFVFLSFPVIICVIVDHPGSLGIMASVTVAPVALSLTSWRVPSIWWI